MSPSTSPVGRLCVLVGGGGELVRGRERMSMAIKFERLNLFFAPLKQHTKVVYVQIFARHLKAYFARKLTFRRESKKLYNTTLAETFFILGTEHTFSVPFNTSTHGNLLSLTQSLTNSSIFR